MLNIEEANDRFRGRPVTEIEVNEFCCGSKKEPIGIIFSFDCVDALSIRLNGNGSGFIFENYRPEVLNMSEFGHTTAISWTSQFGADFRLPIALGSIRKEIPRCTTCEGSSVCSALTISLANSQKITLQNCGDELKIQRTGLTM